MNDRIQELAKQAGFEYHVTTGLVAMPDANPEKFAELIVRECSGIADTYAKGGAGSEFDVGYMLCAQTLSVEIKQHFGIEE
jgi:hypothetical protein